MRSALLNRMLAAKQSATGRTSRLVGPVVLAGLATALLFAASDRSQPWSLLTSLLGVALLGAVMIRQLGEILRLEGQVDGRARQLLVVSEVVAALNSSPNVGGALGEALEKLAGALGADAGAIWLPAPGQDGHLVLVEQRGWPGEGDTAALLAQLQALKPPADQRLLALRLRVPGHNPGAPVACLVARMGRESEEFGYLLVTRWAGTFEETAGQIVAAVASDIGGALRSIRALGEARRLADKDPLTGLQNHRSAYQRLGSEVHRCGREGLSLSVIMLDLDNFKLFNDTYGHPAGDEVLKRVSAILRRSCRDRDIVARYGGDEFMLILPETDQKQALRCAERIQAALAKERFRAERSNPLPIGFSYGVAVFPDEAADPRQLVALADSALYQSKAQGGGRISTSGASLETDLSGAPGYDLFWPLVVAIDNKDGYTRRHSEEVTTYSVEIARALGLDEETIRTIRLSGMLHDVGKIGVPDAILRKPGHLTDEEYATMKQHPVFGSMLVGAIPGMEEVVLGVRHHHERWDGNGYPDRLAGPAIPLLGRILAVADCFSAMTTSRPYRKGLTERQALTEIRRGLGTQFDPDAGRAFIELREAALAKVAESRPARRRTKAAAPSAEPAAGPAGAEDVEEPALTTADG